MKATFRTSMEFDDEELQKLHDELQSSYETQLKIHGVYWPSTKGKMMEILSLFAHLGTPVSQDEIADWISNKGGNYRRQARHLTRQGWYIVSGNKKSHSYEKGLRRDQLMLVSVEKPNPFKGSNRKSSNCEEKKDHFQSLAEYFAALRTLQKNKIQDSAFRCREWLKIFNRTGIDVDSNQWNSKHVPVLLALAHPDEFYDARGVFFGDDFEVPHSKKSFSKKKYDSEKCQIGKIIPGGQCPYVQNSSVQMDHYWPHSLGGPTSNSNMIFLCKTCNQQKSSSPYLYDFSHLDSWLRNRIKTMYDTKSRTW